ncbi:MAG: type IX secretion system sortase PorU, partial [Melioribacteraceae bacterium]|nr:type IX secretion system sortase PorU [Melioribacteraceae bacterium]
NYFWLTYGGDLGKRMQNQISENSNPITTQTTTKAFRFQDNDKRNLIGSGLLNIEDDYTSTNKTKTYTNMLDGRVEGSEINYTFQFVNGSQYSNLLRIEENGTQLASKTLTGVGTGPNSKYQYGSLSRWQTNYNGSVPDNRSVLKFSYNTASVSDKGHLDMIEIQYLQNMKASLTNQSLIFFSDEIDGIIRYNGNVFSNSSFLVFNITDYHSPQKVDIDYSGGEFTFNSFENSSFPSKYIAVHNDNFKAPQNAKKMNNSNLHGFQNGAKYIIISPREFSEQAERLKNYRENEAEYTLPSIVTYTDDIYNEFSCGSIDPTAIRDYLKYAYDNWTIKPEYVLLFGDGDFDYYDLLGKGLNFIPTFQSSESLHEINSYSTDDYYSRISGSDKLADIAIGRLTINSMEQAAVVVDKIIGYETSPLKGLWRNRITLLADDGLTSETNDGAIHTRQSEELSNSYIPKSFDRNKIYLSNYQTVNTGLGRRKPDCNVAIIDAINNGTLIFNYVGHGNPDVLAHEIVFDRGVSIPQMRNKELFFLTAATCDFGKYDNPNVSSGAEEMLLLENAGMIGGVCAIRPVYSGQNDALNKVFYNYLFGLTDSNGISLPIGVAYQKLKEQKTLSNDEKFHLFSDPALRLNIPKLPVQISSVNDAGILDTVNIKALGEVKISGKVLNPDTSSSQFEGEGIVTVFDSERIVKLDDINYNMNEQGGVIYRGRVSVNNGEFSTSFTVPKDISYENKNGKIVAYFFNDQTDGIGFTNNIIVGGTDSSKVNDGKGPEIEILYDNESESSYLVNPNFKLRVKLHDETGLNTTGTGIGHKLEAILNEDEQNSIDLTNYFVGDLNSGGKSGEVNYNFSALPSGEYKIKVNAWDVYNNFASQENYFTVVDSDNLVIREVYNYPNPFSNNTFFTFQHNLDSPLNVKIKIYTIAGRVIKEIESLSVEDKFVKIEWNGRDEDNNKIGNGTYLYKIIAESADGEYRENILGKMAVIR